MTRPVQSKSFTVKLDTKITKLTRSDIDGANINIFQFDKVHLVVNIIEDKLPKILENTVANLLVQIPNEANPYIQKTNISIIDSDNGIVEIILDKECVKSIGAYIAQIRLTGENGSIVTQTFMYSISKGILIEDNEEIFIPTTSAISGLAVSGKSLCGTVLGENKYILKQEIKIESSLSEKFKSLRRN